MPMEAYTDTCYCYCLPCTCRQAKASAELSLEEQLAAINLTFTNLADTPLDALRHPTKAHLKAVDSFDILPDAHVAGNQYMLFKFSDNPHDGSVRHTQPCLLKTAFDGLTFLLID